jgi:hypothetical protein
MKNGDTLRGPRSFRSSAVSAMRTAADPRTDQVPVAHLSSSVEGCQSASSSACRAAAIAKIESSTLRCSWLHPLVRIEGAITAVAARDHASDPAGKIGDPNVSIFLAPLGR